MSPIFKEDDSTFKKATMVVLWLVIAIVTLKLIAFLLHDVLPPLFFIAVFIGPAIWVFWNAQERGVSKPLAWALLVLFTWVIGLVIYLIVQSDGGRRLHCPACGSEVKREYTSCPGCGAELGELIRYCPSCGEAVQPGWEFCSSCGRQLDSPGVKSSPVA